MASDDHEAWLRAGCPGVDIDASHGQERSMATDVKMTDAEIIAEAKRIVEANKRSGWTGSHWELHLIPLAERQGEELLDARAKLALAAEYEAGTEELLRRIKDSRHWAEEGQMWGYLIDETTHGLIQGSACISKSGVSDG